MFLDRIRDRTQNRLKLIDLMDTTKRDDPSFWAEIVAEIGDNGSPRRATAPRVERSDNDETYAAVVRAFAASGSEWVEFGEIMGATGLSKSKLKYLLGRTHKERFESRKHPSHGKKLQWRLVPESK